MRTRHWVISISVAVLAIIGLATSQVAPVAMAAPSGYQMPFFGKSVITNGPGEELHTGRSAEAIDYTPGSGWWSNVAAAQAGTVVFSADLRPATGFGQVIVIRHGDGTYSYYAHLSQRSVYFGNAVSRGQTIGVVGNTGCPGCGTHLHFEARTGVVEPVTVNNIYNTGTAAWIRDVKGNGWFPWYPNAARNSGLVAYSPSHPKGQCIGNPYLTVIWPTANEISGGTNIEGFSWEFSTSATTIPDTVVDGNGSVGSASRSLSGYNGIKWHLHLRVKDTSGNWAAGDWHIAHAGSYCYQ